MHPAIAAGRVAVITGAASGIGLAAARRFAGFGMRVCLADIAPDLDAVAAGIDGETLAVRTDVSDFAQVAALEAAVRARWGEVAVLMNNAGREGDGALSAQLARWQEILGTNLMGVLHGIQAFVPGMVAQSRAGGGSACAVVNTGSKQGITTPPGDTAYNVSKAGIKVLTEALAHDLRQEPGCAVSAHLLIPGFTFTGFTRVRTQVKPDAAWTPEQVIDRLLDGMAAGDFYILCPDNDVTTATDRKRILWAAQDVTENRPPLSRWHPDWTESFASFMAD